MVFQSGILESGAGKQKDGIWKTNFGRKEEVVAYGIGLLVFLEKQWKCGNAYVTIFSKHYISNNLICLLRYSAVSENLTTYQRKISMLLFIENRNKCREVEQRCQQNLLIYRASVKSPANKCQQINEKYFLHKKGYTYPLVKISFCKKRYWFVGLTVFYAAMSHLAALYC